MRSTSCNAMSTLAGNVTPLRGHCLVSPHQSNVAVLHTTLSTDTHVRVATDDAAKSHALLLDTENPLVPARCRKFQPSEFHSFAPSPSNKDASSEREDGNDAPQVGLLSGYDDSGVLETINRTRSEESTGLHAAPRETNRFSAQLNRLHHSTRVGQLPNQHYREGEMTAENIGTLPANRGASLFDVTSTLNPAKVPVWEFHDRNTNSGPPFTYDRTSTISRARAISHNSSTSDSSAFQAGVVAARDRSDDSGIFSLTNTMWDSIAGSSKDSSDGGQTTASCKNLSRCDNSRGKSSCTAAERSHITPRGTEENALAYLSLEESAHSTIAEAFLVIGVQEDNIKVDDGIGVNSPKSDTIVKETAFKSRRSTLYVSNGESSRSGDFSACDPPSICILFQYPAATGDPGWQRSSPAVPEDTTRLDKETITLSPGVDSSTSRESSAIESLYEYGGTADKLQRSGVGNPCQTDVVKSISHPVKEPFPAITYTPPKGVELFCFPLGFPALVVCENSPKPTFHCFCLSDQVRLRQGGRVMRPIGRNPF